MIVLDKWEMLELCVLQLYSNYLELLIFGIPRMELYMYLYMELLYMFSMELLLAGMYLSNICLRKLVDYQWNTIYYLYWKDYPGTLMIGRS